MRLKKALTIREALHCLVRMQDRPIVISPVQIGYISRTDVELLLEEILLLMQAGLTILVVLTPEDGLYKEVLAGLNCGFTEIQSREELVRKALEIGAQRICLVCGSDRIHTQRHGNLDDISADQAEAIVGEEATLSDEVASALTLAADAFRQGVSRVHLVSIHNRGALLEELFTGRGAGVMVYGDSAGYKQVRKARPADITHIVRLLLFTGRQCDEQERLMVSRGVEDFLVYTVDEEVYGCARLQVNGASLEVRDLAHTDRLDLSVILEALLRFSVEEAGRRGLGKVFVPSGGIPPLMVILPWFALLGFQQERAAAGSGKAWVKQL